MSIHGPLGGHPLPAHHHFGVHNNLHPSLRTFGSHAPTEFDFLMARHGSTFGPALGVAPHALTPGLANAFANVGGRIGGAANSIGNGFMNLFDKIRFGRNGFGFPITGFQNNGRLPTIELAGRGGNTAFTIFPNDATVPTGVLGTNTANLTGAQVRTIQNALLRNPQAFDILTPGGNVGQLGWSNTALDKMGLTRITDANGQVLRYELLRPNSFFGWAGQGVYGLGKWAFDSVYGVGKYAYNALFNRAANPNLFTGIKDWAVNSYNGVANWFTHRPTWLGGKPVVHTITPNAAANANTAANAANGTNGAAGAGGGFGAYLGAGLTALGTGFTIHDGIQRFKHGDELGGTIALGGSAAAIGLGVSAGVSAASAGATTAGILGAGAGAAVAPLAGAGAALNVVDGVRNLINGDKVSGGLQLGGTAVGAVVGSIVPGLGTLVGAAIGGFVGKLFGMIGGKKRARKKVTKNLKKELKKTKAEAYKKGIEEAKKAAEAGQFQLIKLTGENGDKANLSGDPEVLSENTVANLKHAAKLIVDKKKDKGTKVAEKAFEAEAMAAYVEGFNEVMKEEKAKHDKQQRKIAMHQQSQLSQILKHRQAMMYQQMLFELVMSMGAANTSPFTYGHTHPHHHHHHGNPFVF